MTTWVNTHDGSISSGDKPYGTFWTQISDAPDSTYDWNGNAWVENAGRLAAQQSIAQDITDLAVVKADNTLTAFVAMTPAQVDAWITANVTNLATATNALRILAKIVLVIARRSLR